MQKVLFVGGGSIGHIAPAVAVAQELKKHENIDCYFVCGTNSNEADFIKKYSFPYATLPHIRRYCISALIQSHRILSKEKPDLILSKGGYVSIPLCLVAWAKKIPIILHESDAVMGRANQFLSRLATYICFGYSAASFQLLASSSFTGNPIRKEMTEGSREEGLNITNFSGQKPILLVLGGSQGAKALNEIVWSKLEELLHLVDVVHITGIGKREARSGKLEAEKGYWSTEFAYEELPHLYAIANCALSRAGANTIAELDANGIPTILVPLRGVGHDHQVQNAKVMADQNPLFIHMEQEELDEKLEQTIQSIIVTLRDAPPCHGAACHPEEEAASQLTSRRTTRLLLCHGSRRPFGAPHHDTKGGAPQDDMVSASSKITKVILEHLERQSGHP